jgi:hypothetical protein
MRHTVSTGIVLGIEDTLDDAATVAQVDKDQPPEVSTAPHPTLQTHRSPDVDRTNVSAHM